MYSPTNLNYGLATNSKLIANLIAVAKNHLHDVADDLTLSKIKSQLDIPKVILEAITFTDTGTLQVTFQHLEDGPELHTRIFNEAKAINSKRRADYQAGKKFIRDYLYLFEFYTGHTITSTLEIHFSGMRFHPQYGTEQIWQA